MTIRTMIETKKRRIMSIALLGFSMIAGGAILDDQGFPDILDIEMSSVILVGMVIFMLSMFYAYYVAFRCPRCGGNLSSVVMQGGTTPGIRPFYVFDKGIRFCPYCGSSIDTELDTKRVRVER